MVKDKVMKILVTGAKGFVGKNLIAELKNQEFAEIFEFDVDTEKSQLDYFCANADAVVHLAGVNRPQRVSDFMEGNFGFTSILLDTLRKHKNTCPVVLSSSTQAALDNDYGKSKRAGEELLFAYGHQTGAKVLVYRFPNIFGKWCRPNYNSAVATFCHNIASGLPITVNNRETTLCLVYIDDVVQEIINALNGKETSIGEFSEVQVAYSATLGELVDLLYSFKESRVNLDIADMSAPFVKKLYSTYLSYLPADQFKYPLTMNCDQRGSFTEMLRTPGCGQVSVNISKPGITKGNHWHHTKNEKFLVVSGNGVIRFRRIDLAEIIEYSVSGDKLEVVDIPVGYTHHIENLGNTDLITIMWVNEPFNPRKPDTYFLEV